MKTYTVVVDDHGIIFWRNNKNQLHCEHGPAIEDANGYKAWFQNNKPHRLDGPAVEDADGIKHWYIKGKNTLKQSSRRK